MSRSFLQLAIAAPACLLAGAGHAHPGHGAALHLHPHDLGLLALLAAVVVLALIGSRR